MYLRGVNMTAAKVKSATKCKRHFIISVWDHKTAKSHGSAKIAVREDIYKLLIEFMGDKCSADLVFTTVGGKRVTYSAIALTVFVTN